MPPKIFLSYSRRDERVADSVVRSAECRKIDVWYDKLIPAGQDWRDHIVDAISNCDVLLILFSEESNNSRQMLKELAIADRLGKLVIPVLLEATEPRGPYLYELAWRNWAILYPEPLGRIDALLDRLLLQLNELSPAVAITGSVPAVVTTQPRGAATAAIFGRAPAPGTAQHPGSAMGAVPRRAPARRADKPLTRQPPGPVTGEMPRRAPARRTPAPLAGQPPPGPATGAMPNRVPAPVAMQPHDAATAATISRAPAPAMAQPLGSARPASLGVDQAQGKDSVKSAWWPTHPIVLRDVLVLGPVLCVLFIISISIRNDDLPFINVLLLFFYILLVIVRSARLNIGINTWKPFYRYLAIGLLLTLNITTGVLLSHRTSVSIGDVIAQVFVMVIIAAMLAGVATLLHFVLRRIFQLSLFKSRIRSTLPIS